MCMYYGPVRAEVKTAVCFRRMTEATARLGIKCVIFNVRRNLAGVSLNIALGFIHLANEWEFSTSLMNY